MFVTGLLSMGYSTYSDEVYKSKAYNVGVELDKLRSAGRAYPQHLSERKEYAALEKTLEDELAVLSKDPTEQVMMLKHKSKNNTYSASMGVVVIGLGLYVTGLVAVLENESKDNSSQTQTASDNL